MTIFYLFLNVFILILLFFLVFLIISKTLNISFSNVLIKLFNKFNFVKTFISIIIITFLYFTTIIFYEYADFNFPFIKFQKGNEKNSIAVFVTAILLQNEDNNSKIDLICNKILFPSMNINGNIQNNVIQINTNTSFYNKNFNGYTKNEYLYGELNKKYLNWNIIQINTSKYEINSIGINAILTINYSNEKVFGTIMFPSHFYDSWKFEGCYYNNRKNIEINFSRMFSLGFELKGEISKL
jgi:hypothetical protein